MRVLFWDIDGTLLATRRAGIRAWETAVERVVGREVDLSGFPTAGRTDVEIAAAMLAHLGAPPEQATRLLEAYEDDLPAALHGKPVTPFPEAVAILDDLHERKDVLSILLTGNTRRGAQSKLRAAGLEGRFVGGAFAHPLRARSEIARAALTEAARLVGPVDRTRALVIGDTAHDVACADAIGVRCLAVATGASTVAELTAAGAWRAVPRLPDPSTFTAMWGAP